MHDSFNYVQKQNEVKKARNMTMAGFATTMITAVWAYNATMDAIWFENRNGFLALEHSAVTRCLSDRVKRIEIFNDLADYPAANQILLDTRWSGAELSTCVQDIQEQNNNNKNRAALLMQLALLSFVTAVGATTWSMHRTIRKENEMSEAAAKLEGLALKYKAIGVEPN